MESPDQRDQIINEMVRTHYEKNLKTEILHQAVSIIDKYLSLCSVSETNHSKISVVALWMASKLLSKKVKKL